MNEINVTALSFEDALEAIRKALQARYPSCGLLYVAYSNVNNNRISTCGIFGDQATIETAGTDIAMRNKHVADFVHDVFCNQSLSFQSQGLSHTEKVLHDAVLDYAKYRGLDTNGLSYYARKEVKAEESTSQSINTTDAIAARIKMLQDEIKSLTRTLDPTVQAQTLRALAKRLRKAGDISLAAAKDKEAEAILLQAQRKEQVKLARIKAAEHARQAKVIKKQKLIQAEIDRQKAHQFNPHAAAKAKMRKIRERQAERAATKKKASVSREWTNRPISQVIASRV